MGRSVLRPYKYTRLALVAGLNTRHYEDRLTWRWPPARVDPRAFR